MKEFLGPAMEGFGKDESQEREERHSRRVHVREESEQVCGDRNL